MHCFCGVHVIDFKPKYFYDVFTRYKWRVLCTFIFPLFPNKKCDFLSVKFGIVYENSFTSFDLCGKIAFYQSARSPLYPKRIT